MTTEVASTRRRKWHVAPALGVAMLLAVGLMAVWPHQLLPHDPSQIEPSLRFLPPVWMDGGTSEYLLGTDALGRDILTQMIAGSRATLVIVLGAGVLALVIGLAIGMIGGHFGGWADSTVMRLVDIQLAFPVLVIVIAVVAVFGPSITNLILVLALASWAAYARMVRGLILSLREIEYVDAAWAAGASHMSIIVRHYLPNVATSIVILTTFEFARLVLVEAALSFLGLGVQPPTPSWGRMIAEGRQYLFEAWWASALPGLLIVLTVLSFNVIGDELRDWLDPLDDRD